MKSPPVNARCAWANAIRWVSRTSASPFPTHDAARLVPGETLYVDGGCHIID